ncbi:efflux RND transporter periplasmic adaptor subunit [Paucidesulfovibrio longus]|uniref:efflux RND transporter periplasmic adaptor subunit n=1 Tax=Paucidesulfovibrio longus TaxID=889 RepID=UPI0003B692A2|nr:efflux RND transporter periplasmic adaptor subunit [Paucidesulfovibrio longus]
MPSIRAKKPLLTGSVLLLATLLVAGCGSSNKSEETLPTLVRGVQTHVASALTVPRGCNLPGTVVSDDRIELSSRVVGFIESLEVREGQSVKEGDLLVKIDSTDIEENIRQNAASLTATAQELQDAKRDVVRYEKLVQTGAIAPDTLTKAKVKRDVAQAAYDKATAALTSARSERLYAEIRSPVDGVVIRRYKQRGDMATAGAVILTIESRSKLLFRVYAPESKVAQLTQGMTTAISIDALPGRSISGTIERIVPSGDTTTRRYQVDIALPTDADLLPGMFGRAEIVLNHEQVLAIPNSARVIRGGLEGVFVLDNADIAHFRWLRFGRVHDAFIEVGAGLTLGETILLKADGRIRDGVQIVAASRENAQ